MQCGRTSRCASITMPTVRNGCVKRTTAERFAVTTIGPTASPTFRSDCDAVTCARTRLV